MRFVPFFLLASAVLMLYDDNWYFLFVPKQKTPPIIHGLNYWQKLAIRPFLRR
jgi:hypothetical protein